MTKIIKLTENDLSRIVRRVLNEQLRSKTTSNPNTPSSTRTTSKPSGSLSPTTKFNGKTVNLYMDIENKKFYEQVKISSDSSIKSRGYGQFIFKTNLGTLTFYCDRADKLFMDKISNGEVIPGYVFYNKNFTTTLKRDLCTKSSGGSNVPNADFASNNQKPNSDFA